MSRSAHGLDVRMKSLTCSPNIEVKELKQGQTVRLNEALTVVEAGHFESVGEISTLREIPSDGHRALVVGHADEERIVWLAEPLVASDDLPDGYCDAAFNAGTPRPLRARRTGASQRCIRPMATGMNYTATCGGKPRMARGCWSWWENRGGGRSHPVPVR